MKLEGTLTPTIAVEVQRRFEERLENMLGDWHYETSQGFDEKTIKEILDYSRRLDWTRTDVVQKMYEEYKNATGKEF